MAIGTTSDSEICKVCGESKPAYNCFQIHPNYSDYNEGTYWVCEDCVSDIRRCSTTLSWH